MIAVVAGIVLLLAFAGLAGVFVVLMSTSTPPPPEPAPEPATPVPVPVPVPEPVPVPLPTPAGKAQTITLTSVPDGAEVWEGNTKLCATPCTTPHPEHAPLPREFVFKLKGYKDKLYAMDDPSGDHEVRLSSNVKPPTPKPGPRLPKIETER
jgi:hypothetical protein